MYFLLVDISIQELYFEIFTIRPSLLVLKGLHDGHLISCFIPVIPGFCFSPHQRL